MTDINTKSGKSGKIGKRQREVDDDDDNVAVTPVSQSANKSKHVKFTSNSTISTKNSPESSEDEKDGETDEDERENDEPNAQRKEAAEVLRQQQPRLRKQLEGADEKGDTLIIQVEPIKPLLKLNHKSIATYRPK